MTRPTLEVVDILRVQGDRSSANKTLAMRFRWLPNSPSPDNYADPAAI